PAVYDGEGVAAYGCELVDAVVRLVEHPDHPAAVGEVATERLAGGHRLLPLDGVRFDVPDTGPGGGGGAAGAAVALVGEDDVHARLGGLQRGPGRGGAATDDEYVGGEFEGLAHRVSCCATGRPASGLDSEGS